MEGIQFIYDMEESRKTEMDCYVAYDFNMKEIIQDAKLDKTVVALDRKNQMIYFYGMDSNGHERIDRLYYYKLIQQFVDNAYCYFCENYSVFHGTKGGQIYYKYNKEV